MVRHSDTVCATLHAGNLVRIRTTRIYRGVDVGGSLWLGVEAQPWLADALCAYVEDLISDETAIGPDSLRVRVKGHEFDPQVGIGNVRAAPAEHAGRYFIAIRDELVPQLVEQLRALSEGTD